MPWNLCEIQISFSVSPAPFGEIAKWGGRLLVGMKMDRVTGVC